MTDLAETRQRLREYIEGDGSYYSGPSLPIPLSLQDAKSILDALDRAEAENRRLRKALKEIERVSDGPYPSGPRMALSEIWFDARTALKDKP